MTFFRWENLPRPILCLAPMAGYTDSPYRQIIKLISPSVICFTEFTSVDGIVHGNEATMRQISFNPERERPIVAQIFGKKPENFYKAAAVLAELGADAIDINMGCPAKKIISSDHGSALLKNPTLAEEIVKASVESASRFALGVSIKMRIGTSCYDPDKFFDFALRMERAGASLITIHGRTSKQMYGGVSNWQPIYDLKKIVKIPVIGNGDIRSGAEALGKIGNLDGLMVGRGSFGNPWIFEEIRAAFSGKNFTPPSLLERFNMIKSHTERSIEFKGEKFGIIEMRKHFCWHIKGFPSASILRQRILSLTDPNQIFSAIAEVFLAPAGVSQGSPPAPHASSYPAAAISSSLP